MFNRQLSNQLDDFLVYWDYSIPAQFLCDQIPKRCRRIGLAVNNEGLAGRPFESAKPSHYLARVRVGGEAADAFDVRANGHHLAMDLYLCFAILQ